MSDFVEAIGELPELSDEDWDALIIALVRGTGADEFEEEDAERFAVWIEEKIVAVTLIRMMIKGELMVKWSYDDWNFKLTEYGKELAEQLLNEA